MHIPDEEIEPNSCNAWDTLLQNGMFPLPETHIVAIEHDPTKAKQILQNVRTKNPQTEYRLKGDYIESVHWYPMPGSDIDTADAVGEVEDYVRGIIEGVEMDQMESLREAFPEEYT